MGRHHTGSGITPGSFFGHTMNRGGAIECLGCVLLLVAGFACADSISSSILCDGACFVSSSVIGQGTTYAASLFTSSIASIIRDLQVQNGEVRTMTGTDAHGPMGIEEYTGQTGNQTQNRMGCVFGIPDNRTMKTDEIRYSGLLMSGTYASTRHLGSSETAAATMVNGTGIILARASSQDQTNRTAHSSDVTGRMDLTERIIFGGET